MKRRSLLLLVACVAFLTALACAKPTMIYETGFEPSDVSGVNFAVGNLDGQGGWVATNATVTAAQAESGVQSVQMAADSSIERALSGSGKIWIIGQYRGDGSAAVTPSYPATPPAACIVHFSQANGVQCLDGDGAGGGSFIPSTAGQPVSSSTWTEVALHIAYDAATPYWDCLLNGAAYQTGLGFRDNISSLSGFKSLSGTESFFDSLCVVASDGDVDGDGIGDVFEIDNGTDPTDPASAAYSLFDVNGDGKITAEDAIRQYRIAKAIMTPTTEVLRDANCDGLANEEDALVIYDFVIGKVAFLPQCK